MQVVDVQIEKGNWSVIVDGHTVRVINDASEAKLLVDEKVQDIYYGMAGSPVLFGELPDNTKIKARIGGDFKIHCAIFVDNQLVLED